jgi:hypothetical protein
MHVTFPLNRLEWPVFLRFYVKSILSPGLIEEADAIRFQDVAERDDGSMAKGKLDDAPPHPERFEVIIPDSVMREARWHPLFWLNLTVEAKGTWSRQHLAIAELEPWQACCRHE